MPRPTQGHVVERPWADGETISYGAQVRAYGRYEKVTFGTNKQGWNRTRAELETERIMQHIERGTWVPPRLQPREDRLDKAMAALGVQVDETFRAFASRWWRSKQLDLAEKTFVDYTGGGETALTRIGASSSASGRTIASRAPFMPQGRRYREVRTAQSPRSPA